MKYSNRTYTNHKTLPLEEWFLHIGLTKPLLHLQIGIYNIYGLTKQMKVNYMTL